jgi:hypothetical protein
MSQTIEPSLLRAPIELVGPRREERAQTLRVDPEVPARAADLLRPARSFDALAQVGEHCLVHGDGVRLDRDRLPHDALQAPAMARVTESLLTGAIVYGRRSARTCSRISAALRVADQAEPRAGIPSSSMIVRTRSQMSSLIGRT